MLLWVLYQLEWTPLDMCFMHVIENPLYRFRVSSGALLNSNLFCWIYPRLFDHSIHLPPPKRSWLEHCPAEGWFFLVLLNDPLFVVNCCLVRENSYCIACSLFRCTQWNSRSDRGLRRCSCSSAVSWSDPSCQCARLCLSDCPRNWFYSSITAWDHSDILEWSGAIWDQSWWQLKGVPSGSFLVAWSSPWL